MVDSDKCVLAWAASSSETKSHFLAVAAPQDLRYEKSLRSKIPKIHCGLLRERDHSDYVNSDDEKMLLAFSPRRKKSVADYQITDLQLEVRSARACVSERRASARKCASERRTSASA